MPIPQWEEINPNQSATRSSVERGSHLVLVPPVSALSAEPTLGDRITANLLDLVVVSGLGFGAAKVFLILALAPVFWHGLVGQNAPSSELIEAFWPLWASLLWTSSSIFCALHYFVLIPYFYGRTLGQGICGLSIVDSAGGKPTFQQLLVRFSVYVLAFTSAGFPLYYAWRKGEKRMFMDELSGTHFRRSLR